MTVTWCGPAETEKLNVVKVNVDSTLPYVGVAPQLAPVALASSDMWTSPVVELNVGAAREVSLAAARQWPVDSDPDLLNRPWNGADHEWVDPAATGPGRASSRAKATGRV